MLKRIYIYATGLVSCSVCTSYKSVKTIEKHVNRIDPTGISSGWKLSKDSFSTSEPNPCPCNENPETHKHYLLNC